MKKNILAILILLSLPDTSYAGATENGRGSFFKYGLGIFETKEKPVSSTKMFSVGFIDEFFGPLIKQYEVGGYFDNSQREGIRNSAFGNFSLGIDVRPGNFVFRSMWGVGGISHPDSVLGGHFQFNQDFYLGVMDNNGNSIGFDYKHISSAGIEKPNIGRDFITIQLSVPW